MIYKRIYNSEASMVTLGTKGSLIYTAGTGS